MLNTKVVENSIMITLTKFQNFCMFLPRVMQFLANVCLLSKQPDRTLVMQRLSKLTLVLASKMNTKVGAYQIVNLLTKFGNFSRSEQRVVNFMLQCCDAVQFKIFCGIEFSSCIFYLLVDEASL